MTKSLSSALSSALSFGLATVSLAIPACSSSSDDADAKGSAPTLDGATFDRGGPGNEVKAGALEVLQLTIDYADADGDIAKIGQQMTSPDGSTKAPSFLPLTEANGQKQGRQVLGLQLAIGKPGNVDVDLWLVDSKGNESTRVKRTIAVK